MCLFSDNLLEDSSLEWRARETVANYKDIETSFYLLPHLEGILFFKLFYVCIHSLCMNSLPELCLYSLCVSGAFGEWKTPSSALLLTGVRRMVLNQNMVIRI